MKSVFCLLIAIYGKTVLASYHHNSQHFYNNHGGNRNYNNYKREPLYPVHYRTELTPDPPNVYNIKVQPNHDELWKKYVNTYNHHDKDDYDSGSVYEKDLRETNCDHSPATMTEWTNSGHSVVVNSIPEATAKVDVVKYHKAGIPENVNIRNLIYHHDHAHYEDSAVDPHDLSELMITVNLEMKKNKTDNDFVEVFKPNSSPMRAKMVSKIEEAISKPQTPERSINPAKYENHKDLDHPMHLFESGKYKLKETHLSEHDKVIEVILPSRDKRDFENHSESETKKNQEVSSDDVQKNDVIKAVQNAENDSKDSSRPIIKNRFVVLHLKDGDKMIQDPLLKFLTKV